MKTFKSLTGQSSFNNDAKEFDDIATNVFAPIYPVISQQIVQRCNINSGIIIDVGSGTAALAISLSHLIDGNIYTLDISEKMYAIAKKRIDQSNLSDKITPILEDVHNMPFEDGYADLIVSRGSLFFWQDVATAFRQIYRVLKPGGFGYIGGGFGTSELKSKISNEMVIRDKGWIENVNKRLERSNLESFEKALKTAKINDYEIIDDESGFWILFKKVE
ncbi:class I SAM-dependent methyltransferase [Methanococcoides burtonii]|uniref:Methyltransferase n=1 Tax=Methanococcoides burtonii (strain DSM 6242 / NBRC 107633 / OCM 468 / ACE-M) TaxID=259564 RepID=Q12YJ4_METBU|nr:class I SAM-dependent methyltransferase [Methanococcoides burtonii]ABE51482.1 methyltransferase [Methanococcoides burtonii DSM 6242]